MEHYITTNLNLLQCSLMKPQYTYINGIFLSVTRGCETTAHRFHAARPRFLFFALPFPSFPSSSSFCSIFFIFILCECCCSGSGKSETPLATAAAPIIFRIPQTQSPRPPVNAIPHG